MTIGFWILTAWIIMGVLNIPIWRHGIEKGVSEVSPIFDTVFVKRVLVAILMVMAPYWFGLGVYKMWKNYYIDRNIEKKLREICERSGLDFEKEFGEFFNK